MCRVSKKKKYTAFAEDIVTFDGRKLKDMKSGTYKSVRKALAFEEDVSARIGVGGASYRFYIRRTF
jgi:hypothetical protein